ncbi:MAG: hypothetical protein WCP89_00590 [archaeon]
MHCAICGKSDIETELFRGVNRLKVVPVCEKCAIDENIPLLKKPSNEALKSAEQSQSVRERMERLSGISKSQRISHEQHTALRNLAKIRMPLPKQSNDMIIENYSWAIQMARRRLKMTTSQLANQIGIPENEMLSIEKAQLPANFEEIMEKLEVVLEIKLLKARDTKVIFKRQQQQIDVQKEILESVKKNMDYLSKIPESERVDTHEDEFVEIKPERHQQVNIPKPIKQLSQRKGELQENLGFPKEDSKEKKEKIQKIYTGEMDFSRRDQLKDVTLNDLVKIKKERERSEKELKSRKQTEEFLGDDDEISLDEE